LTDKVDTAQSWAIRKVELESEGTPTILCYEIDNNLFMLKGQRFPADPNIEWLDFICSNRRNNPVSSTEFEPRHDYNWVTGAIADDKVVDVVAEYLRGEITSEEAICRAKALPKTYQLSLHTLAAINFVDDINVTYRQLKKGRWVPGWTTRQL